MSNLKAIKRVKTSSSSNSKLRAEGLIPAILYGGKDPNQNISIESMNESENDQMNEILTYTYIHFIYIYI